MLRWFKELRLQSEARQLNRDAPEIITHAKELFQPKIVAEIATATRTHIDRAQAQYGTSPIDLKRAHFDYKRIHKEARRRGEQSNLSTLTLTIIHIRAQMAGVYADPARLAIEAFIDEQPSPDLTPPTNA